MAKELDKASAARAPTPVIESRTAFLLNVFSWVFFMLVSLLFIGAGRRRCAPLLIRIVRSGCTSPWLRQRRSEEHTSELQSLMRISYAVFCLQKKQNNNQY